MTSCITKFAGNDRGSITAVAAVSFAVLIAAGGMALSYSVAFNNQTKLQAALDSAVLAGTILPGDANDTERVAAALSYFNGNTRFITNNKDDPLVNIRVSSTPSFTMGAVNLTGVVTAEVYNPFGAFIGDAWTEVHVRAVARKVESVPVCVLGLDPTQSATIDFNGQARLDAVNCAVQANSKSGSGISQVGHPMLTASAIGVTGGATGTGYNPPPQEGTSRISDSDVPGGGVARRSKAAREARP